MEHNPTPILRTERLKLRGLLSSDADFIHHLRSDESINRFLIRKTHLSIPEAKEWIEKIISDTKNNLVLYWVIELDKPIGGICLWNFKPEIKEAELGYMLLPSYHRKGITSEAMEEILKYAYDKLSLKRIIAYTRKDNNASRFLLEKNGFEHLPEIQDEGFPDNVTYLKA